MPETPDIPEIGDCRTCKHPDYCQSIFVVAATELLQGEPLPAIYEELEAPLKRRRCKLTVEERKLRVVQTAGRIVNTLDRLRRPEN